jgi:phosphate transport system permease protein
MNISASQPVIQALPPRAAPVNGSRVRAGRKTADMMMKVIATSFTLLAVFVLFWILGMLVVKGIGGLSVAWPMPLPGRSS